MIGPSISEAGWYKRGLGIDGMLQLYEDKILQ